MHTATIIDDIKELLETHEKEPSLATELKIQTIACIVKIDSSIKLDLICTHIKNMPIQ